MKKTIAIFLCFITIMSLFTMNLSVLATFYENENNNTRATAMEISVDEEAIGMINYEDDIDWYKISIPVSCRFVVTRSSNKYLDMNLYRTLSDGTVVHEQESYGNYIYSVNSGNTVYYISVESSYSSFDYELKVEVTDTSSNYYEKENNDYRDSADQIGVFAEVTGIINVEDDIDWYKVTIPVSGKFSVTRSSNKYLEMKLYRVLPNGTISLENETYGNTIQYINSGSAEYYISVTSSYESFYYTINVSCDIPTPSSFKAKQTTNSIKLNWSRVSGITGYVLYRYSPNSKKYTKIANLGSKTTSYSITGLKAGKEYTYAIRSCYKANGKIHYSDYKYLTTATKPNAPAIKSISTGNRKVTLSWKKCAGAQYYQVYMSQNYTGKYKRIATTDARKIVKKGLSKNQTYYFKVRSYKVFDGGRVYSAFSDICNAHV